METVFCGKTNMSVQFGLLVRSVGCSRDVCRVCFSRAPGELGHVVERISLRPSPRHCSLESSTQESILQGNQALNMSAWSSIGHYRMGTTGCREESDCSLVALGIAASSPRVHCNRILPKVLPPQLLDELCEPVRLGKRFEGNGHNNYTATWKNFAKACKICADNSCNSCAQ